MLSPVDEIKNKLDVVEVVSGYIKLQKAGRNLRANCPFHNEKTPSFFVSPERQTWHCFGCGAGGSIFDFVMQIEGVEFVDALRILARRAGVVLKREDPQLRTERQRLYQICELAVKFFEKQLAETKKGKEIVQYLLGRGIKKETINSWGLGYAPDDWQALGDFLKRKGFKDGEIIKSGLAVERGLGAGNKELGTRKYYDRFRNRIIFPIFDLNGQVVGFSGRILPDDKQETAKYINTPQTPIYDKSRILYGLDRAKMEIRKNDACIIVEGYTDVLMSHQAGFRQTVANCGTALTDQQLKIIKRYSENLILSFDMDVAGDIATKRAIDLAIEEGFNVKIILPAEAKDKERDPADIIKDDPKKWEKLVEGAEGVIEYYFANTFSKYNAKEVGGKKAIAKIILPVLKRLPDKVEQAHWLSELGRRLGVKESFLVEAINKIKIEKQSLAKEKPVVATKPKSRRASLEEEALALMINSFAVDEKKADLGSLLGKETVSLFSDPSLKRTFLDLQACFEKEGKAKKAAYEEWRTNLSPDLSLRVDTLMFKIEARESDRCDLAADLDSCLKELKKEKIKQQLNALQQKIKASEKEKDKEELSVLLEKFRSLSASLLDA